MFKQALRVIALLLPYLASGFLAPFIFHLAPTPQWGGRIAGLLFTMSALWALGLAIRFKFGGNYKKFFTFIVGLNFLFWAWRFFADRPLKETFILGINAQNLHFVMTGSFLVGAGVLIFALWQVDFIKLRDPIP